MAVSVNGWVEGRGGAPDVTGRRLGCFTAYNCGDFPAIDFFSTSQTRRRGTLQGGRQTEEYSGFQVHCVKRATILPLETETERPAGTVQVERQEEG